jgi:hypothetical protein
MTATLRHDARVNSVGLDVVRDDGELLQLVPLEDAGVPSSELDGEIIAPVTRLRSYSTVLYSKYGCTGRGLVLYSTVDSVEVSSAMVARGKRNWRGWKSTFPRADSPYSFCIPVVIT